MLRARHNQIRRFSPLRGEALNRAAWGGTSRRAQGREADGHVNQKALERQEYQRRGARRNSTSKLEGNQHQASATNAIDNMRMSRTLRVHWQNGRRRRARPMPVRIIASATLEVRRENCVETKSGAA